MAVLVMLRHGQSQWNRDNRFTGWVDVPLSQKGIQEAIEAGKRMAHIKFDLIFTSTLSRARTTTDLAMAQNRSSGVPVYFYPDTEQMGEWGHIHSKEALTHSVPVRQAWELNERMYGSLQGLNKDETRKAYGVDQVHIWRRSYDVAPPGGESLKMTAERSIPYFREHILPPLLEGKNVLVSAHGNSLRSLVMELDHLDSKEVVNVEIETGEPIIYQCERGQFARAHLP